MNRTKRAVINTAVGFCCRLACAFAPFMLRSVLISKLGIEYLGLSNLFASILTMLSLSELGFSSAVVFALYKPVAEKNSEKIAQLMTFYKKVYRYVGFFIFFIGLILLPNIEYFIKSDYPASVNIHYVFFVYLINASLSYWLFAYKNALLVANMRSDIESFINTGCQLSLMLLQIILLTIYANYYLFVIVIPVLTIVNNMIRSYLVDRLYPDCKASSELPKNEVKDILGRVYAVFWHRIAGVVFSSADTVVISSLLGLAVLGKYANYWYIHTSVYVSIAIIFNSSLAVVGNSLVCRSKEENYETFLEMFFINSWLTGFCSCCFLLLYQPFIYVWLGKQALLDETIPILLAVFFYVHSIRRVCQSFKDAAGLWQEDFWKPIVSSLVNIVLNIFLVKRIGLPGVLLSSIFAVIVIETPWECTVLFRYYFNKSKRFYWTNYIQYVLVSLLLNIAIYRVSIDYLPEYTLKSIVLRLILVCTLFNVGYGLIFFRSQYFKKAIARFKLNKLFCGKI